MRTVLVVEDHTDTTHVLVETLRLEGWNAIPARNAEEALELAGSVRFDLVVADFLLPGMTGEALEHAFGQRSALAKIPFVFITGFEPAFLRLGPGRVLLKPFSTSELLAAMEHAVSTARTRTWTQSPRKPPDDPDLH
jgi:CheY-like chemotaxis protein